MSSFALASRRVLVGDRLAPAAVVVRDGKIAEVCDRTSSVPVEDLGDLVLMPGLVDSHVHINEPGRTEWEGFETATRAAAAGGVTTLVDMPLNCIPVTTTADALRQKLDAARPKLWVDCGFWGGVVPGNAPDLGALAKAGVLGAKAFLCHSGIDDFPQARKADLLRAMPVLRDAGLPLLVHAELVPDDLAVPEGDEREYGCWLHSRPAEWEEAAIALSIELCRETGCAVHVVHLSAAGALPMIAAAKAEGLPFTVETCPHYLVLTAEEVGRDETHYKCAPPIREAANREALWEGLRDGTIDLVVTDHSPCTPHLKDGGFIEAWGGIASLQFGLSSVWTAARRRGFSEAHLARWMCAGPARLAGLSRKGRLAPGFDADLVAWDPETEHRLTPEEVLHRHRISPWVGRSLMGRVRHTWLSGEPVLRDGAHVGRPRGRPILERA